MDYAIILFVQINAGVVQWLESQPSKLVVWVRFPSPAPKREVVPLGTASLFCYTDGNRTRSNNKQSTGLFVRRGNERKRGDRHGSAETNSHHPLQKEKLCLQVRLLFFVIRMGIEQGAITNSPLDCLCDAATSVSEAIGTAVPRQIPITRSKIKSVLKRERIFILYYSFFNIHHSLFIWYERILMNNEAACAN